MSLPEIDNGSNVFLQFFSLNNKSYAEYCMDFDMCTVFVVDCPLYDVELNIILQSTASLNMTLYNLIEIYLCFGRKCSLCLHGRGLIQTTSNQKVCF
jgi:hypothetical protein